MAQLYSLEVVLKNSVEAVIIPLKDGISSLNSVYEALIKADVDPVTGQCSNNDYIREQIGQAHHYLQTSEQMASSELNSLNENLERLNQEEGKLEQEINATTQTLDNLTIEDALLSVSQEALEQARRNHNSTKQALQYQQNRKKKAEIVTGVGAGILVIPVIGWFAGSAMVVSGGIELDQAAHAVKVAEEEMRNSETEVNKYESKVAECKSRISQLKCDINQKEEELKQTREGIWRVKKQIESVAEFQMKVRSATQLLSVLSGRTRVAELHIRRFIFQEPVMKVMEDVIKATEQIIGNELLCGDDIATLINQIKENNQRLAAICDLENSPNNDSNRHCLCCFKRTFCFGPRSRVPERNK